MFSMCMCFWAHDTFGTWAWPAPAPRTTLVYVQFSPIWHGSRTPYPRRPHSTIAGKKAGDGMRGRMQCVVVFNLCSTVLAGEGIINKFFSVRMTRKMMCGRTSHGFSVHTSSLPFTPKRPLVIIYVEWKWSSAVGNWSDSTAHIAEEPSNVRTIFYTCK